MKHLKVFFAFFAVLMMLNGCATAPKAASPAGPDARDKEIARLQSALEEQKVLTAEAEARAAKAENDLREAASAKPAASKLQDPYLK